MNRLWVRISLMIGAFLMFVFFIQFLTIKLDQWGITAEKPTSGGFINDEGTKLKDDLVIDRLIGFMSLSIFVGFAGGVVIGRYVSAPIDNLARTAEKIAKGDRSARAVIRGSSEIKQLASTFNHMVDELQQAEELRKTMMADVSHELRIPLTILSGNLRAVMDKVYPLDEVEVANLYIQTHHLIRLVNDLRELSLAESNKLPMEKSACNMLSIISETLQALDPLIVEKNIQIKYKMDSIPELIIDPIRIKQVWFNLITNALSHTPSNGSLTFTASVEPGFIKFSLKDTGEGMEADKLREVFNRFYRADESRSRETGGTGLGLAIVKALIEMHGGQVFAESAGKGKGCTFSFTLQYV